MKHIKIWIFIIIIFVLSTLNTTCFSLDKENNNEYLWLNNINDKDIKIGIESVEIINKTIYLDKKYDNYAIITMNVKNTGLDYVELANINYSISQQDKKLETFIQSENNYFGFIGELSSGDEKTIKICVALDNINFPIEMKLENLSDPLKKKIKKEINL